MTESHEPRPRHHSEVDDDPEAETEHLVHRIVHEEDASKKLALALLLDDVKHVNATAARFLPALLAVAGGAEPAFAWAIAAVVRAHLADGDVALRTAALEAAERFVFEPGCTRPLLDALPAARGPAVRVLIDAAEGTLLRGEPEDAWAALASADAVLRG